MEDFYDRTGTSSYWELSVGDLLNKEDLHSRLYWNNFHVLKSTKVARLRELYVRSQRGMRSYEGVSRKELEHIIAERRILIPELGWANMEDLKRKLEQYDDEHNTFHRFLDLPPELRERIYTLYFNNYDEDDSPKCQPPISCASRIVRREALPLFYECCLFSIRAATGIREDLKPINEGQNITDVLSSDSAAFMKSISAHNLGRLRWLRLNLLGCELQLMLYANDQKDPIHVSTPYKVDLECNGNKAKHERRERMFSEARAIALNVAGREGPLKLREGDLGKMYEIVQIAFVELYPQGRY
jgi:hypothetical protein